MNNPLNVLIIGAGACGAKAASRIRRLDPEVQITILDQGRYISYAGCGLPYYISGKVHELDDLLKTTYGQTRDTGYFKKLKNVNVRTGVQVQAIDRIARMVYARIFPSGVAEAFSYDKLVLAQGASPIDPPVEGVALEGVYHLTKIEDAAAIAAVLKSKPTGVAVIIGAGFIGLEATEALIERGWRVTLAERCGQVLPGALDFEIAAMVQEHLFENRVDVELNCQVLRIEGENGRVTRVVTRAATHQADLVILAAGLRPNVDLARGAGLEIGETGALAVNRSLQTSDPNIYAGGDLVENVDMVSERKCFMPLGSTANKHGRIIGDNICGLGSEFPGVLRTFVCKVFNLSVGATGLTAGKAAEAGIDASGVLAPGFDKAHYYPASAILGITLTVENRTGRLLGLQAAGRGDVARRIDVAATALRFGATIDQLADLDLAYAPPFSQAMDCLLTAANGARNKRDGLFKGIAPVDARRELNEDGDAILLDVGTEMEFRRGHLEVGNVIHIPLDQLPTRLGEVPRGRRILCLCRIGIRGYAAQRILEGAGFSNIATIEGGQFMWPWKEDLS